MSTIIYNREQFIVSNGGIYKLLITQDKDRNTNSVISYNINLGGKDRKCLNLQFPSKFVDKSDGYLSWVESHNECSFESFIESGKAQHILLLGFTIARDINPNLKKIYFDDISNIICQFPTKEDKIPLKPFHIAFYKSSWYEYYFDAKLVKDYDKYVKLKENFDKPEKKPQTFDFMNDDLQKELTPLYKKSDTWSQFFEEIKEKYGRKKCAIIYPWINNALYIIFENDPYFESIKWYIDLEENKTKNKTHPVYFEAYKVGGRSNKRKTRKNFINRTYIHPNVPEVSQWNYSKFIRDSTEDIY
jgi:hypothetical protein